MTDPELSKVGRTQYMLDREHRKRGDELEQMSWYTARQTHQEARAVGMHAVEAIVEIVDVKRIDDGHEITAFLVDADGRRTIPATTLLRANGIIYDPEDPDEEGYLMAYASQFDDLLKGTKEKEKIPVGSV